MGKSLQRGWVERTSAAYQPNLYVLSLVDVHGDKDAVATYTESHISNLETLYDSVMRDATNFAAGLGGHRRFLIAAFRTTDDGDRQVMSSVTFSVDGGGEGDAEGSVSSEPPNETGLLAQLMRHNEVSLRAATAASAGQATTMRELQIENDRLRTEKLSLMESMEGALTEQHIRKLATERQAEDLKFRNEMFNNLIPYVNAALAKVASKVNGGPFVRPVTSDVELSAKALLHAMPASLMDKLASDPAIPNTFKLALGTLMETAIKSELVTVQEKAADDRQAWDLTVGETREAKKI